MVLKDRRIFIIEDQMVYMAITATYLRLEGAEVESELCWKKVPHSLLQNMPIDLILMDLILAGSASGFELVDDIRRHPELAQIPIIALSSADPETAVPIARQKGFSGFISKPISPLIARHVASVLDGRDIWTTDSWEDYWTRGTSKHWGSWNQ